MGSVYDQLECDRFPECPKCGSPEYKNAGFDEGDSLHIVRNRVCRACGTEYKPPLPLWTPVGLVIVGLSIIASAVLILYNNFVSHITDGPVPGPFVWRLTWWGVLCGIGWGLFGLLFVGVGFRFARAMWFRKRG